MAVTLAERARAAIAECPEWYHSIELAPGVVTPGRAPLAVWNRTLERLRLPDLHAKSVLDIGAYDGFFSFAVERLGAAKVVALDDYAWSTDTIEYMKAWRAARTSGIAMPPPHRSRHWDPATLPGRRPFDAARDVLGSNVDPVVGNFMTLDPATLGRFDVVLFLGILYHMEDPLAAMRRVAEYLAPGGFLGLETEAVEVPGAPDAAFCEFFPVDELNGDDSNWWAPNAKALEGLVTAAGLVEFALLSGPPRASKLERFRARMARQRVRYRAVASARRPRI
ncbi:MAG: class I SAM-dependent methyltransferase [Candidatus Tyrphobacter sp.]